jgi:hypothetical protein
MVDFKIRSTGTSKNTTPRIFEVGESECKLTFSVFDSVTKFMRVEVLP